MDIFSRHKEIFELGGVRISLAFTSLGVGPCFHKACVLVGHFLN